jgi:two-component system response regulator PrrA
MISANHETTERVRCLEAGADDFLMKPFDSSELTARIDAVIRRSTAGPPVVLRCGTIEMRVNERVVLCEGKKIELSQREFSLLEFLLRNKNQIVTRQRILQQVWGYDFPTETNIVDVYISYLRRSLGCREEKKWIHTIHGEGFLLAEE